MVAVVLLTTLLTPLALRSAYDLQSPQDLEEELKLAAVSEAVSESRPSRQKGAKDSIGEPAQFSMGANVSQ